MELVKTGALIREALDWAVAKSLGYYGTNRMINADGQIMHLKSFQPSVRFDQAGSIIDNEKIAISNPRGVGWTAEVWHEHTDPITGHHSFGAGETFLLAAMRCYVASKLGNAIEVPDEILAKAKMDPTYDQHDIVDVLKEEVAHGYALTNEGVAKCLDEIVVLRERVVELETDLAQQVRECQRLNKLLENEDESADDLETVRRMRP